MVVEIQNPPQNDPLADTFLLPRTLGGFSAEKGMDLEIAHGFLSSKVFRFPTPLFVERSLDIREKIHHLLPLFHFFSESNDSRSCNEEEEDDDRDILCKTKALFAVRSFAINDYVIAVVYDICRNLLLGDFPFYFELSFFSRKYRTD